MTESLGYYCFGFIGGKVLMSVWRRYTVIIPISLSIALLVTACSESKASQCERLVSLINKGSDLIDKNKGQQVTTSLQLSKDLEAVTKEIKELNLKDPKLQQFQSSFVKVFETFSQSIATAGKALGSAKTAQPSSEGRVKIQKARGEIDTALTAATNAAKQSDTLASELNKYCSSESK
jgi:preprotein translocase subunit SecF